MYGNQPFDIKWACPCNEIQNAASECITNDSSSHFKYPIITRYTLFDKYIVITFGQDGLIINNGSHLSESNYTVIHYYNFIWNETYFASCTTYIFAAFT